MRNISFGNRILLLILLLLIMSVLSTLYLMHIIKVTETSMLASQNAKLENVALLFDQSIPDGLGESIEQSAGARERAERIEKLGQMLNTKIGEIKKDYPEVHLGILVYRLDIFYDGTLRFGENYSLRRKNAFDEVIETQQLLIQDLGPEKGGVVEVYRPYIRNGRLEGVIRSAEYLADTGYYDQRKELENTVYVIIALVIATGTGGSMVLFRQFVAQVHNIKAGVRELEDDLKNTLPPAPGELGEIVGAINRLATKIAHLNLYNEKMLASIDDAIIVVDNGGRIVISNNMAGKMFGVQEKAKGSHFSEILPKESPFGVLLKDTLSDSRLFKDLQVDWVNEGHISHILVSTSTLADYGGTIIGAVLSCRDITERIRLEEKVHLQERLASLGKLVAGVAHEIRNPLTTISCYIQHWQNQNKPNPRALATMYREVARLDSIVDQLLYFAKPAEAQFSFNDINKIVDNVMAFFSELHQGRYNLVKNLKPGLPRVWIDTEQIERVVVNIMFNALQALPEEGTVIISTDFGSEEDMVEVSIADNGCGIPQENLVHLFDPFYSTRPKGTGLGLAIVHEIIKAHGGHIEVKSEVGQGTRFAFYLSTREDV
ncbi:MAG: histidine kinase [Peptococcaceae bacterium BICA1-7]|nr:MAG: histidine kinase [Peptococcaceae bacterium BICA1-7]HBV99289.1 two-component system sensor histidine kinase AtoS [Desulfotomaculum sp.]